MRRPLARPFTVALAMSVATAASIAVAQVPSQPQPQTRGGVTYLSGGAGDEEVQLVKQSMKDYTVALAFARAGSPRAEYVADVAVVVRNGPGETVFEAPSVGPYLLLKLPAGAYTVVATYRDRSQTRSVTAGKAGASPVTFEWK